MQAKTHRMSPDISYAFSFAEFKTAALQLDWKQQQKLKPQIDKFLSQFHSGCIVDDLSGLTISDCAKLAHTLWMNGQKRRAGEQTVRIYSGIGANGRDLGRDIIEVIGPDMMFLVASILAQCGESSVTVTAMFHPVSDTKRDENGNRIGSGDNVLKESYIQMLVEPLDEDRKTELIEELKDTLDDVRVSVADFQAMQARMIECAEEIKRSDRAGHEEVDEAAAFLHWLSDGHFAFLGTRIYEFMRDDKGELKVEEPGIFEESGLGVLRDPERFVLRKGFEPTVLSPRIRAFLEEPSPIIVAKSNVRSRVHRRVYADYIGIKRYDKSGEVIGEVRFVGLFTSDAYNQMTRDVPFLRLKVRHAIASVSTMQQSGHSAKALQNVLETFPRDELFQISEEDLLDIATGILHLRDRPRAKLFIRRDRFDRFISALTYLPREDYNATLQNRIGETLRAAFDGRLSAVYPHFDDGPLARIHFIIGLNQGHPEPDISSLNAEISVLAESWESQFARALRNSGMEPEILAGANCFKGAFNAGYRETFDSEEALLDVSTFHKLDRFQPIRVRAFRLPSDSSDHIRAKIYVRGVSIPLSDCVPILENMGLFVISETGYPVYPSSPPVDGAPDVYWIHSLFMRNQNGEQIDIEAVRSAFEDAFIALWTGRTENDGFNRLILALNANWREAALFRTLALYRKQTGLDPARTTQITALTNHIDITKLLLELFNVRFDPASGMDIIQRQSISDDLATRIREQLEKVTSLDEDRVLRRFTNLILATKRTNFFQIDPDGMPHLNISLKISSAELEALPAPRPYREIFVWAPNVEGIHIRFGPVARGGLRWSDRRDDFRTEVLGLVKAQQVKNAVIVPVGSKGGFFPKNLPVNGSRDAIMAAGVEAYKTFITGMLQITDNLVKNNVVHPDNVIVWDDDDPYLVVAADKGTATFSDIANAISQDHGFWLGDAFASGGSVGYDHKKMGITARGAWEAVKRHFREMGKDIQNEAFTVIGCGDMSGDVFGNGMLLSKHIRLVAAFNHMEIFIDPDPQDPERLWGERQRLFNLPRSSWSDYNKNLISEGGGVFSRSAKSIALSTQIKAITGLEADEVTPNTLIHALLKAECELLWFGGIGTYIKATEEQHFHVGDKVNDAIRINADELKAKVIGEGANLGVTQAGRIEFARLGGCINTDAVDNSAGVDSSDHEVNIKILISEAIRSGILGQSDRVDLLAAMTDDVASHVLVHNYEQTGAISVVEAQAAQDLDSHERFMVSLEKSGRLDRIVEGLPDSESIRLLREQGEGLSRPEISVILAYAKITLFDELTDSNLLDDEIFFDTLSNYFPSAIRKYTDAIHNHRLKREIIGTILANDIVNLGGPTFVHRVCESTETNPALVARAFVVARAIFRMDEVLRQVNTLDNKVPAIMQIMIRTELMATLMRVVFGLVRRMQEENVSKNIADIIKFYRPGSDILHQVIWKVVSPYQRERMLARKSQLSHPNIPDSLIASAAALPALSSITDIIDLAEKTDIDLNSAACFYHALGDLLRFDRLRDAATEATSPQHWDRLATRRLVEDMLRQQAICTQDLINHVKTSNDLVSKLDTKKATGLAKDWLNQHDEPYKRLLKSIDELEQAGNWTFAKLVLLTDAVRTFMMYR